MKNRLLTRLSDPATTKNPGRMELPELVPVNTAGEVAVVVAPAVAPTLRVVPQGAQVVSVVVISMRV